MEHGHAAWASNTDMQHTLAVKACSMACTNKQHGYAWACDEQHGHEART
jgi:hypothetical protein